MSSSEDDVDRSLEKDLEVESDDQNNPKLEDRGIY